MKRISAVFAALLVLFALFCGCDNSDYYSTPNVPVSSVPHSDSAVQSPLSETAAPPVPEGEYSMVCSFVQSAVYAYEGSTVMSTDWDMESRYDFTVKKTDNGLRLSFTIAERKYVYSYNGEDTVIYDTSDESTKNADTELYFDLIGHGFTVDFDEDMKITSVGGTKKLYSEVEGSEDLLGEYEIKAIAEELLLSIPKTVTLDTSISHSQSVDFESSMEMQYTVASITDNLLKFNMSPVSEYGLPASEYYDSYTVEYTDAADYTGTLSMMSSDRFLQSSTNRITYYSTMTVIPDSGDPYALEGVTVVTDSCEVEKK